MANCDIKFFGEEFSGKGFKSFVDKNFPLLSFLSSNGLKENTYKDALKDYNLVSGGANGADTAWRVLSKVYGVSNFKEVLTIDLDRATPEEKAKAEAQYKEIAESLDRKYLPIAGNSKYSGKLLRRNMLQVKEGVTDSVFSIGLLKFTAQGKPYVDGGTAYATEKGVRLGLPVYVFDQGKSQWYSINDSSATAINIPTLTKNATLIGSREMDANSIKAIHSVIDQTVKFGSTTVENFKTKINQFNYTLTPSGEVIHNSKSGDKVETNETQIGKVYAAYAKENSLPTQEFNKQQYAEVHGKVVNVNTGSVVTQKEIVDKFSRIGNKEIYTVDSIYNSIPKNIDSSNVKVVQNPNQFLPEQSRGEAVVAYRNSANPNNSFGNPFSDMSKTTEENVKSFIDFVLNHTSTQAQWIRESILSGRFKDKPIYYGNTRAIKNREISHAQALDYLIKNPHVLGKSSIESQNNKVDKKSGSLVLNKDQAKAKEEILEFLSDPSRQTHSLVGYAGTGKTTLLNEVLKDYRGSVIMGAPTNRAVAVMRTKSNNFSDFRTIHQMLSIKADMNIEEYDANDVRFAKDKPGKKSIERVRNTLIVIDESSMINDSLFAELMKEIFEGNRGNKVLFVGDMAQLNPVKQISNSKALNSTEQVSELTIVERAENNAVLGESMTVRNTGNFSLLPNMDSEGNGVTYTNSLKQFSDKMIRMFTSDKMKENPLYLRVVAALNAEVDAINAAVKQALFPGSTSLVNKGELLMGASNWDLDNNTDEYGIENSGDLQVISTKPLTKMFANISITGEQVVLKNLNSPNKPNIETFLIGPLDAKQSQAIADHITELIEAARRDKRMWYKFFQFTSSFITDRTIVNPRTGKAVIPRTIVPGYAHTIHKSQGGTYENIGVIANGLEYSSNWTPRDKAQLRYVAVTRAEKGVYISTTRDLNAKAPTVFAMPTVGQVIAQGTFNKMNVVLDENAPLNYDASKHTYTFNPNIFADMYNTKVWDRRITLSDGSVSVPLEQEAFKTIDEFTTYMFLVTEIKSRMPQHKGETLSAYNFRMDIEALKVLQMKYGAINKFFYTPEELANRQDTVIPNTSETFTETLEDDTPTVVDDSIFDSFTSSAKGFDSRRNAVLNFISSLENNPYGEFEGIIPTEVFPDVTKC